ncbi:MAG: GAF domain-containing protein [Chloroflexota bacterium]|nr:MAG: hypothetical protein KatS3mg047_0594 [Bellilinea sp.]
MNFIRQINPANTPSHISRLGELAVWRERILQSTLLLIALGSTVIYYIAVQRAIQFQDRLSIYIYTGALVVALAMPFLRKLAFNLRTLVILLVLYGLGVQNLVVYGVTRNAVAYILAIVFLAGLLWGVRAGVFAILLNFATVVGMAYGMNYGGMSQPLRETLLNSMSFSNWVNVAIHFSLVGGFILISIYTILNGLQSSLLQQRTLTMQLNAARLNLEKNVEERTAALQRRLNQIRTAAEIARAVNTFLDPETLLQQSVDLIQKEFDLYYAGIFLIDERGEFAVLKAGTGDAGRQMIAAGHKLAVGSNSMIGWATARKEPRIALDTGAEAVRFNNPYLPLTRSEMALPIISRGVCLGALTIQSTQPEAFDQDDIRILMGIADSLATALENARLFQETQQNLEEIRALNRAYLMQSWEDTIAIYGKMEYSYQNPAAAQDSKESNLIHIPLTIRDQAIGNLTLDVGSKSLTTEEMEFIDGVINQTAIALENARLIQETQRRALEEQRLSEMTAEFSRANTVDQILKAALLEIGHLPNVAEVSVHLIPPAEDRMEEVIE